MHFWTICHDSAVDIYYLTIVGSFSSALSVGTLAGTVVCPAGYGSLSIGSSVHGRHDTQNIMVVCPYCKSSSSMCNTPAVNRTCPLATAVSVGILADAVVCPGL